MHMQLLSMSLSRVHMPAFLDPIARMTARQKNVTGYHILAHVLSIANRSRHAIGAVIFAAFDFKI